MPDWFNEMSDIPVLITITIAVLGVLGYVINSKIDKVLHEMFPNSGKSMRDAIDTANRGIESLDAKLDSHIQWHLDNTK